MYVSHTHTHIHITLHTNVKDIFTVICIGTLMFYFFWECLVTDLELQTDRHTHRENIITSVYMARIDNWFSFNSCHVNRGNDIFCVCVCLSVCNYHFEECLQFKWLAENG